MSHLVSVSTEFINIEEAEAIITDGGIIDQVKQGDLTVMTVQVGDERVTLVEGTTGVLVKITAG